MIQGNVFKTIMVGDNGTPEAEHAVEVAVSLAQGLKAKVILLGGYCPTKS